MKTHHFDVYVTYEGDTLHAVGTIDPGEAPTGPSYDCGGTPGEPAHVDDVTFYDENDMEKEDPEGKIINSVHDDIMELAGEDD